MDTSNATTATASRQIQQFFQPQQSKARRPPCDIQDITAVSTPCINADLFLSDFSADYSSPWTLNAQELDIFGESLDQPPLAAPPTSVGAASSASSEDFFFGLPPLFLEQQVQDNELYSYFLQHHSQGVLHPSPALATPAFATPAFSSLDGLDMTVLGPFDGVSSEHGLGQNKGPNIRYPSYHHDILNRESQGLTGSDIHILPHPYHDTLSLHGSAAARSHDGTTAASAKATLFSTSSASPEISSSSNLAVSSELHIPPRPKPRSLPVKSRGAGSKRNHTVSPLTDLDSDGEDAQVAIKRHRNTMAARRYRQKRLDLISDLEQALDKVTGERNELKLQLARREAEVDSLREMLSKNEALS